MARMRIGAYLDMEMNQDLGIDDFRHAVITMKLPFIGDFGAKGLPSMRAVMDVKDLNTAADFVRRIVYNNQSY